ncbi:MULTISPECIES: hypothetical protein [unclassified Bradyrhizobium]|uniref:hypothetical protein n=1 Tax=unclassified Bradyrhizobium TaxID=2631580 RepID=UPI001BAAC1E1|nr:MULTISPECIES: hypothetical protein [unclassified Bradyrhizobium]MBR1229046.1 hypothetical protein [Bradyrhizobium sp. AUGA SZCCT0176]MBR1299019.1 hypothetical protein [Bradyrhizobium sp. AUGA SZCCT0042]
MLGTVSEFCQCQRGSWRAVYTPVPNDTCLNGNALQRVIELVSTLRYADLLAADENFSTSSFAMLRR